MNKENYNQYKALQKVAQEYFNNVLLSDDDYLFNALGGIEESLLSTDEKSQLISQAFNDSDFNTLGSLLHRAIESNLLTMAALCHTYGYTPSADQSEESAILAKAEL